MVEHYPSMVDQYRTLINIHIRSVTYLPTYIVDYHKYPIHDPCFNFGSPTKKLQCNFLQSGYFQNIFKIGKMYIYQLSIRSFFVGHPELLRRLSISIKQYPSIHVFDHYRTLIKSPYQYIRLLTYLPIYSGLTQVSHSYKKREYIL
jgi:hypothetical protein